MRFKENNYQKGVTLIALIVTIVVLLILSGVSISLVVGDNGLIKKALEARDKHFEAVINEEKEFNELVNFMDEQLKE